MVQPQRKKEAKKTKKVQFINITTDEEESAEDEVAAELPDLNSGVEEDKSNSGSNQQSEDELKALPTIKSEELTQERSGNSTIEKLNKQIILKNTPVRKSPLQPSALNQKLNVKIKQKSDIKG